MPAVCIAVALFISGAYAICGPGTPGTARCAPTGVAPRVDGQLPDDGP
jgi:hypothetical protein